MSIIEVARHLSHFKAAIFDLDGTLIHSEHVWERAKKDVLARYNIIPDQDLIDAYVGRGLDDFLIETVGQTHTAQQRADMADQIGAMADQLLPKLRKPIPAAVSLLRALHASGVRIAVCSSAPRKHILSALVQLGIADLIESITSGAELPKGKPDPLPYVMAVKSLALTPQDACAFEDSLPGAQSAFDANLSVFAIGAGCSGADFSFCNDRAESYMDFVTVGLQGD